MLNLLWKEWHEQSWKLSFASIVLGALAFIGFRSRLIADETMLMWVCFLGLTMLPVFASAGLVAAERGEGTLESLLALPVTSRRILGVKTILGIVVCVVPLVVAMSVSLIIAGGREMTVGSTVAFYGCTIVTTISLFIWMLALTIRLPSETRAALLSVGVLILWMLATGGLAYPSVPKWAMFVSPFCMVFGTVDETLGRSLPGAYVRSEIGAIAWAAGQIMTQAVICLLLLRYASRQLAH